MKLHLGIDGHYVDLPYSYGAGAAVGFVADVLEAHYGVMRRFAGDNHSKIASLVTGAMMRSVNSLVKGRPVRYHPAQAGFGEIKREFRDWILQRSLDGRALHDQFPIPTAAALAGVNHRLKHPYSKYIWKRGKRTKQRRPSRASFYDTGLYANSFKAWSEK
jgi:hypothetical protein